jgi:catechol 2,3-dioxygenase-like lactoylglutathione lyase family enzyme
VNAASIDRVLEACLYAHDLDAAERFYVDVLGLERYSSMPGRHVFFRCGSGMFLGPGHVAFAIPDADIPAWRTRLEAAGVAIESEVAWPRGGRSLYVRDPAGNCVELASPKLWGFEDA